MDNKKIIAKAISLGAKEGFRGVIAPTLISYFLNQQSQKFFGSQNSRGKAHVDTFITKVLSPKGKKYPLNPNRIASANSFARVATGAMAGARLFKKHKIGTAKGLMIGAGSAIAISVAGHYLQKYLHKNSSRKDSLMGALTLLVTAGNHFLNKDK